MIAVKVCIGRSVWWTGSGDPCSSGARNATDRHELICLCLDLQSKSTDRPGGACVADRQHGGDGTQGSELALPSSFVEPPRRSPLHPPTAKIPRGLRGVGFGASRRQDRPLFAVVAGSRVRHTVVPAGPQRVSKKELFPDKPRSCWVRRDRPCSGVRFDKGSKLRRIVILSQRRRLPADDESCREAMMSMKKKTGSETARTTSKTKKKKKKRFEYDSVFSGSREIKPVAKSRGGLDTLSDCSRTNLGAIAPGRSRPRSRWHGGWPGWVIQRK